MASGGTIITDWHSKDPLIILALRRLNELPDDSKEKMEALAELHFFQAKLYWKEIAKIEAAEQ